MTTHETLYKIITPVRAVASGLALEEISKRTKIAKKYLLAIEEGRLSALPPGAVYRRNLIKKYARAVGANPDELLNQLADEVARGEDEESTVLRTRTAKISFLNLPRIIARLAVVMVGLTVLGYMGWQIQSAVRPPLLLVNAPHDGFVAREAALTIQGQAEAEATVTINGEPIYTTGDGYFREIISLQSGLNEVRITATKKHGRKTELVRQVIADLPKL